MPPLDLLATIQIGRESIVPRQRAKVLAWSWTSIGTRCLVCRCDICLRCWDVGIVLGGMQMSGTVVALCEGKKHSATG
jgi:hypothetical protein